MYYLQLNPVKRTRVQWNFPTPKGTLNKKKLNKIYIWMERNPSFTTGNKNNESDEKLLGRFSWTVYRLCKKVLFSKVSKKKVRNR
jgi:hypothetical protein